MRKVIPAVLEKDFGEFQKSLEIAQTLSKRVQIDVADGWFVKNKTIGPKELEKIRTRAKLEFHLMVSNPKRYFDAIADKADIITVPAELDNAEYLVDEIIKRKKKPAVALNPETNIKKLIPVINKVKKVIVMTVAPGKQGSRFISSALEKIKGIKMMNKKVVVQVDGGIDTDTIGRAETAGADEFVVGHMIIGAENPRKMYDTLRRKKRSFLRMIR